MARNGVLLIANETYEKSYHGKVEHLGYPTMVAGCADCHGFHSILPPEDPRSTISKARLVETCGKCHLNANANFVQWIPHANHYDKENFPVLYWTFVFMTVLLAGVFGVFWLHSFLWWQRAYREKRRMWAAGVYVSPYVERPDEVYRRFSSFDIAIHVTMVVSFLLLVLTGLPLKFSHADWARGLVRFFGGAYDAGLIHRTSAIVTFGYFGIVQVKIIHFLFFNRDAKGGFWQRFFGPDSLAPRWQDLRDIRGMIKWFLGKGPKPRFDRWTYWEKFDFFGGLLGHGGYRALRADVVVSRLFLDLSAGVDLQRGPDRSLG